MHHWDWGLSQRRVRVIGAVSDADRFKVILGLQEVRCKTWPSLLLKTGRYDCSLLNKARLRKERT